MVVYMDKEEMVMVQRGMVREQRRAVSPDVLLVKSENEMREIPGGGHEAKKRVDNDDNINNNNSYPEEKNVKQQQFLTEPELVQVLGNVLKGLSKAGSVHGGTDFTGNNVPKIDLCDYLRRLIRYANEWQPKREPGHVSLGLRSLIISIIYIDRLCQKNINFTLTEANIHRLVLIAMLLSIKALEDVPFPNSFWARVGGISLRELNKLESSFLSLIDFSLYVDDQTYQGVISQFSVKC